MRRDGQWWEVQRRIAQTPKLLDDLYPYLLGTQDFETTALDALEESANRDDTDEDFDIDVDSEVDGNRMYVENALNRYAAGYDAEDVLLHLLQDVLGAQRVAKVPLMRLRAQHAKLLKRIEMTRLSQVHNEQILREAEAELSKLDSALAFAEGSSHPSKYEP